MHMIEVTNAAAEVLKSTWLEGKVVRMFLVNIDASGANYNLGWGDPAEDDKIFESNGIEIHMSPDDAEILGDSDTVIDYVDTEELGTGFVIEGTGEEVCACNHDHGHEHGHEHGGC